MAVVEFDVCRGSFVVDGGDAVEVGRVLFEPMAANRMVAAEVLEACSMAVDVRLAAVDVAFGVGESSPVFVGLAGVEPSADAAQPVEALLGTLVTPAGLVARVLGRVERFFGVAELVLGVGRSESDAGPDVVFFPPERDEPLAGPQ